DTLPRIKICVGYRLHDAELDYPPSNISTLARVEPIYEDLPGWQRPTSGARRFDQLPEEAQSYVARLCELIGARIGMVSVGPGREQIITVKDLF
ncbi:MAG TPA: adenylosuccinate synthetase, partial [Roseiflexaceae bacterium]|nr:adenylosuccinate synthetase [Roseiflexaceae bacterium]